MSITDGREGSDSVIRRCRLQCPLCPKADTAGRFMMGWTPPFVSAPRGPLVAVARTDSEQAASGAASVAIASMGLGSGWGIAHRQQPGCALSCGTFDPRVDLAAKHHKSIGLVRSASAPPSNALRFVSASP
jgi:hypothetical protein